MNDADILFVTWSFVFQTALIFHFALRKWRFDTAMQYGPIIYAMGIPAAVISLNLWLMGATWSFWFAGVAHLAWAIFGYRIEYVHGTEWRSPILWPVFVPYVFLYLLTIMFYWWPLGLISRPLWYAYAVLFVIATILNVTSHTRPAES